MIVKKSILKIVFCCITLLFVSSCVMDKVLCNLKIINKAEKNFGTYFGHYPEEERNIRFLNETLQSYYNVWNENNSTTENFVSCLNEYTLLSKSEYQTICGPKIGSGYDSIVIKYINIDSLFSNYLNNTPVDSFKGVTEIWYDDKELEKNDYKIEFTDE